MATVTLTHWTRVSFKFSNFSFAVRRPDRIVGHAVRSLRLSNK
jgi:hypothetical protein